MNLSLLEAALVRFLEAATRTARERRLAKTVRTGEKQIVAAFQAQGAAFIDELNARRDEWPIAEAIRVPRGAQGYLSEWILYGGEVRTRGEVIAEMAAAGTPQRLIDAYMIGARTIPGGSEFEVAALKTLVTLESPIQAIAQAALEIGIKVAVADLGDVSAGISFDLANPRAVAYLEQYGAERVTMVNDTTREVIKGIVAQGVDEGWSYDQTAKAITDRFAEFADGRPQEHIDSRAHLVAVTEAGEAYEAGNHMAAEELAASGIEMEHFWLTVGDDKVDVPDCLTNQEQGWIPLAQAFQSGHPHPLAHPACRCSGLSRRKPDQDLNAQGGAHESETGRGS